VANGQRKNHDIFSRSDTMQQYFRQVSSSSWNHLRSSATIWLYTEHAISL